MTNERPGPLADKLRLLFEQVHNPLTGRPYTYPEAAAEIVRRAEALPKDERAGRAISASYVWQLANGKRRNPTIRHLESLADLFGVPPNYLLDAEAWAGLEGEIALITAMRDADVRDIAHRARGLSPGALRSLKSMIDHARTLEGLPPDADRTTSATPSDS